MPSIRALVRKLDSPLYPLLITSLLVTSFTFLVLRRTDFNFSEFITAGDVYCDPKLVPRNLTVAAKSGGYDAQFYYRLARNPFTSKLVDYGIQLDNPPYRHQRILYPFLVWAISLGHPDPVPWLMITLNFVLLCSLGWIGAVVAREMFGRHALWGLLIALYPGFLLTYRRDLAEILEVTLVLVSLLSLHRRQFVKATLFLMLALLAKETSLLVAVGAGAVYAYRLIRRRSNADLRWYYFGAPLLLYVFMQIVLYATWGLSPVSAGRGGIGAPLVGLTTFVVGLLTVPSEWGHKYITELTFFGVFTACVLWALYPRRPDFSGSATYVKSSWALYAALALALTTAVWVEDWAFMRALSEYYALGALVVLGGEGHPATRWAALAATLATWGYVCYWFVV